MSDQTSAPQVDAFSAQAQFFHPSVSRWLERKDVTIACGRYWTQCQQPFRTSHA